MVAGTGRDPRSSTLTIFVESPIGSAILSVWYWRCQVLRPPPPNRRRPKPPHLRCCPPPRWRWCPQPWLCRSSRRRHPRQLLSWCQSRWRRPSWSSVRLWPRFGPSSSRSTRRHRRLPLRRCCPPQPRHPHLLPVWDALRLDQCDQIPEPRRHRPSLPGSTDQPD